MSAKLKTKKKSKKLESVSQLQKLDCADCKLMKYMTFNFSFAKEIGQPAQNDLRGLLDKMSFLSQEQYTIMIYKYIVRKQQFIEKIDVKYINKSIPEGFKKLYFPEISSKFDIFRIYPAGVPKGTANPRVIGMIKKSIFYVFYIDWSGKLYEH